LKTVELFAGIGGFRIGADALGLETVWANDWDEDASTIYRSRFGHTGFQHGDITELIGDVPDHDILTAGFPCQPFSFAGKKKGLADERADTFTALVRVLERLRPSAFVLENVRSILTIANGRHFKHVLLSLAAVGYAVEWRVVNALDFGLAQNRKRTLIVGFRSDLNLNCQTVLGDCAEWNELATKSRGEEGEISRRSQSFPTWGQAMGHQYSAVAAPISCEPPAISLSEVLESQVNLRYDFTDSTLKRLTRSTPIGEIIDGVEVLWNQEGGRRMGYTVFGTAGASPTLTSSTSRHYERYKVGDRYRRLTPTEYARLQGFPDDHCDPVAHGRQYCLLGNAVPPVVAHHGLSAALSRIGRIATAAA
jgi:DNA (cytosine-5)-methyltransferase 1